MSIDSKESLGSVAAKGAKILLIAQLIKFSAHFIGLILLSRLLIPSDFGLTAIAIAIIGFGEILRDLGLSSASIREPNLSKQQQSNLFWINLAIGSTLTLTLVVLSPFLSNKFDNPKLTGILIAVSFIFFMNGLVTQHRADLNRTMRFKELALVESLSALLSLAGAITLAAFGLGYWSIVAQYLLLAFVTCLMVFMFSHWIPTKPRRDGQTLHLIKFGYRIGLSQLIGYLGNNVDTIALGYFSSAKQVGYYNRAFQLVMSPMNQLKSPAATVAIPALSRQLHNEEIYSSYISKGQHVISYTILPIAALIAGAAYPIVDIALGDQWVKIAGIVSLLCVAAAIQQLTSIANWAFVSRGMGKESLNYAIISTSIKLVLIICAATISPLAVAAAYTLSVIIVWPAAIIWSCKGLESRSSLLKDAFRLLIPPVIAGSLIYLLCLFMKNSNSYLQLTTSITVLFAFYSFLLVFPSVRRDLRQVKVIVKKAIKK